MNTKATVQHRAGVSDSASLRLVKTAAEWRLLGVLLERPRPGWHEGVQALCAEVGGRRLRAAGRRALNATEGEYLRILGPGASISPREVAYCGYEDPGRVLAELAGFYEAFGYHPRAEDPVDHVAVEAGFVGYLFLKEAFARADLNPTRATLTAEGRTQFIGRHLAPFACGLADRLGRGDRSYLRAPARLLAARVPANAPPPASVGPDVLATCGGCETQGP